MIRIAAARYPTTVGRVMLHLPRIVVYGNLAPSEVAVEFYVGRLNAEEQITNAMSVPMQYVGQRDGMLLFEANAVPCSRSGRNGYTVRVRPFHEDEARPFLPGLVCWADERVMTTSTHAEVVCSAGHTLEHIL
jgi:hypothetical protein